MASDRLFQTIINMAGNVDPSVRSSIDTVQNHLEGVNIKALAVGAAVAATFVAVGVAAKGASDYLIDLGDDFNAAMNGIQADLGATKEEMESLSGVSLDVYANNFGENIEDVADAVSTMQKYTGYMKEDLQKVTEGAFILSDAFEYEVSESARAAQAMILNFGVEGEEALSLIAAGAQNGLDFSGELLDNINEYSVQFKKVGFDADDMFSIFQAGADNGAWNLDKIGDAIKEFSIRSIDGSTTSTEAFEALGYNAEEMFGIFSQGGEDSKAAFKIVLQDLMDMDDLVARDAAGVGLFGTMWEDLGPDVMNALAEVDGGLYDTNNALEMINDVKYNDLGTALDGLKRQIEADLIPVASEYAKGMLDNVPAISEAISKVMPHVVTFAEGFAENMGKAISLGVRFGAFIIPLAADVIMFASEGIGFLSDNADILAVVLGGATTALAIYKIGMLAANVANRGGIIAVMGLLKAKLLDKAETMALGLLYIKDSIVKGASTAATVAQNVATGAWNIIAGIATAATTALGAAFTFLTGPIGLAILAIAAIIAIGVALYKNWDVVKEKATQLGSFLSGVWTGIKDAVGNLASSITSGFSTAFGSLVDIIRQPVNSIIDLVNGAISSINSIGFTVPDWVPKFGGQDVRPNISSIPMLASGGFTEGLSIAGEAGREAVISFDQGVRNENIAYWTKAGQMLGALPEGYGLIGGNGSGGKASIENVTFAPNIEVKGNANKEDIMKALKEVLPEFIDFIEDALDERERFAYEN